MIDKIKNYVIGIVAGIFALIGIYIKGKSSGKQEEKAKQNEKVLNDVKKVSVARSDNDKRSRVRSKYSR